MDDDDDCPGCGASVFDREKYAKENRTDGEAAISTALMDCPHCYAKKCCMCDMGDDTDCISCDA
jgi:hypothetical protein